MSQDTVITPIVKTGTKVLDTDSAAAAFNYSASGVYSGAMTNCGSVTVCNAQVAVVTFFGVGADGDTFTCQIWGRVDTSSNGGNIGDPVTPYLLQYIGLATCTLSTMVGLTGSTTIPVGSRLVDTIGWAPATSSSTPSGNYSDMCTALGIPSAGGASSPANNTPATLILPILGEAVTLVFDFKKAGTTTGMNAIAQVNPV